MLLQFVVHAVVSGLVTSLLLWVFRRELRLSFAFFLVLLIINCVTAVFGNMVIVVYVVCGWALYRFGDRLPLISRHQG